MKKLVDSTVAEQKHLGPTRTINLTLKNWKGDRSRIKAGNLINFSGKIKDD
jgi:hypothetical protein